ncbi:MAG: electron transfer flavoprotein subunit beta [Clostridiaceae bacterium]
MNIIVCIKQVPDTTDVKIDPKTNTLMRAGVPSIVNPFDENAVEAALQLKEAYGGTVTVISMGPPQAKVALKACLAKGADKAYLISDRAFGGADTLATSYTLACAIKKIGNFDIILCGKQAIDGDTAQVGPEMAEHLDIAQITYVSKIEVKDEKVFADKEHEEGLEKIEAALPVLLTVVKSINEPRLPNMFNIIKANRAEISVLTAQDLDADENKLGLKGSATQVVKVFSPPKKGKGFIVNSDTAENSVKEFLAKLTTDKII